MSGEGGAGPPPSLRHQAPQSYEMIARVSGGMAHDLSNLLTSMILNAEVALEEVRARGGPVEEIDEILKAAHRASGLLNQLLAFGRRQVLRVEVIDLSAAVATTIALLADIFSDSVSIHFLPAHERVRVRADRDQLAQLVVNLVANARDAMPEGGTVTVRVKRLELAAGRFYGDVEVAPGRYALLTVADTGQGMDPDILDRIFHPFFTTKDRGFGAGLGLSVVYGIVKQSGGYVFASSAPGEGSLFEVFLPEVGGTGA